MNNKPMLQTEQYHYVDDVFELTFKGICLLRGFFFFIQAAMPGNLRLDEAQDDD
ncbi:hypothetical protein ACFLXB_07235 [Chloroflexota bacterium]